MKINGLDDQSLLLVFDRLSVVALLRAGRVCSRWNTIRGKAALSRKSLTLLIGPNALKGIKKSDICKIPNYKLLTNNEHNVTQIPSRDVNEVMSNTQSQLQINSQFSSFHINFLSQLFANVQNFTISCPDMNENATLNIPLVNDLLVKWSAKLITLKLYIYSQGICVGDRLMPTEWIQNRQILLTINSMSSLKVLHLDFTNSIESPAEFEQEDAMRMLDFMKRLTQFHFDFHFELKLSKYLIDSLNMHGDRIKEIATPFSFDDECLLVKPKLANRFSQFVTSIDNAKTLAYLSNNFINLTILHISLEKENLGLDYTINANTFYRSMASLNKLIYLNFYCKDSFLPELLVDDPTDIKTHYGHDYINGSVQVLEFGTAADQYFAFNHIENHAIYERLCLYHFFPHTRVFIFDREGMKCDDCQFRKLSYERYCLRQMLAATGMQHHCELIKTTGYNEPSRKWSKEELVGDDEADLVYSDLDDDEDDDEDDSEDDNEGDNESDEDDDDNVSVHNYEQNH